MDRIAHRAAYFHHSLRTVQSACSYIHTCSTNFHVSTPAYRAFLDFNKYTNTNSRKAQLPVKTWQCKKWQSGIDETTPGISHLPAALLR